MSLRRQIIRVATNAISRVPAEQRDALKSRLPNSVKRRLQSAVSSTVAGDIVTASNGQRFVPIDDRLFAPLVVEKVFEDRLTSIATRALTTGDTAVDIGANFGWYAMAFAAEVGSGGSVIAIEPNPRLADVIRQNASLNNHDQVEVLQAAVGAEAAEVELVLASDDESGLGRLTSDSSDGVSYRVQLRTLDEILIDQISQVALLKADVQGFELEMLNGAGLVLGAEHPPVLQLELNPETFAAAGIELGDVLGHIQQMGWVTVEADGEGLRPFTEVRPGVFYAYKPGTRFGDRFCGEFGLDQRP